MWFLKRSREIVWDPRWLFVFGFLSQYPLHLMFQFFLVPCSTNPANLWKSVHVLFIMFHIMLIPIIVRRHHDAEIRGLGHVFGDYSGQIIRGRSYPIINDTFYGHNFSIITFPCATDSHIEWFVRIIPGITHWVVGPSSRPNHYHNQNAVFDSTYDFYKLCLYGNYSHVGYRSWRVNDCKSAGTCCQYIIIQTHCIHMCTHISIYSETCL